MSEPLPPLVRGHHDMGGLPAGKVEPSEHDYDEWERRVDAMMVLCTGVKGKRRCRYVTRSVRDGVEVVERDIQLNPFVTWQQGPAYPSNTQYDLESTILHELGHFANPTKDNHVFGCENSPMIDAIAPGEFWRDADDWLRYGCSASPGVRQRMAVPAGPELKMLVVEHRLP